MTDVTKLHSTATRIDVALDGGRAYPILLGDGLLGSPNLLKPFVRSQVLVVSNAAVGELYLRKLRASLSAAQVDVVEIGDGERFKTLDTYAAILNTLVAKRHNRTTTVVALGGGVVGDVAGFAAATYQRGVNLLQVPTTLLALVDSSVGGKTAVNHPAGKNLIGAFHQPCAVVADVNVLRTLPMREFRAGLAEVVKYGVIADADFFRWLEDHMPDLLAKDAAALLHAVQRSCEIKAQVVADDEREQGRRAILNFGHTFGHAIEAVTDYRRYLHGEAVAIGMAMAMHLSVHLGRARQDEAERLRRLLDQAELPATIVERPSADAVGSQELPEEPALEVESALAVLTAMGMDKKVVDGHLRLVVCDGIGHVSVTSEAPRADVLAAIESSMAH